jgi:hypothetical protein
VVGFEVGEIVGRDEGAVVGMKVPAPAAHDSLHPSPVLGRIPLHFSKEVHPEVLISVVSFPEK